MSGYLIIGIIAAYFGVLLIVAHFTKGDGGNQAFFIGDRNSPWYVVAFGMIGASLSGVTFISVPGWVAASQFSYMQMVLGYLVGYAVIALVLMPLYYRLNLVSIYGYFEKRFGRYSYRTAAVFFLISRIIGASFRLFLVATVFQLIVVNQLGLALPFWVTVSITIALIWVYTASGGIKTIVWTDTLQTAFMLVAVVITIWMIKDGMGLDWTGLIEHVRLDSRSETFFFDDFKDKRYFWKNFIGGAFIALVMTGMDQDMMQKNLSCRNLKEAQKNMFWFSTVLVVVNVLFLALGVLLYQYAELIGVAIPDKADQLYPLLALQGDLGIVVAITFILGLVAAAYSSADSALTSLTTSFCIDLLGVEKRSLKDQQRTRKLVHVGMSVVMLLVIVAFNVINEESVVSELFKAAGYTYGPILGLFAFGMFSTRKIPDKWSIAAAVIAPLTTYWIQENLEDWLDGYQLNFELIVVNGLLMYFLLLISSYWKNNR